MEEKITSNERMIKASSEIDEEFSGDRLKNDFKQLEVKAGGLDAEGKLFALKQKMGMLPAGTPEAPRQIAAGASVPAKMSTEEVLAAEIEELTKDSK